MKNFVFIVLLMVGFVFIVMVVQLESFYVKVEDFVLIGGYQFSGVDIDVVELVNVVGMVCFYVFKVIVLDILKNVGDYVLDFVLVFGLLMLIDLDVLYVVLFNGGLVVVIIDIVGVVMSDDWLVQVFEVDGMLYENGVLEFY